MSDLFTKYSRTILFLMCIFATHASLAKSSGIEVNYLNVIELNNELRLDAEIAYELNSEIREALMNGISLIFQVEVQLVSSKEWRLDKIISSIVKTHLLKYHALSKQFILENLETGKSDSFPDLESVLLHQGRVSAVHVAEMGSLNSQENYIVQMRSRLLTNKLPLPLRMKSYFSPKWRLNSGWHEWPL